MSRWLALITLMTLGFASPRSSLASPVTPIGPVNDVAQAQALPPVITACANNPGGAPPCKDGDGDGLCDAWEKAQRLPGGAPLPGADPKRPDIYVEYDWMGYGGIDVACATDFDCPGLGTDVNNGGFPTCTGPKIASSDLPRSCQIACQSTSQCRALGLSHTSDECIQNLCLHTADPEALAPGALDAVAAQFAAHGINLHIVRGREVPHSHVLSFRLLDDPAHPTNVMTDTCEGGSLASGTAGLGSYAESFYDIKSRYFDLKEALAFHYAVFSHYSSCDTDAHCNDTTSVGHCDYALNPDGTPKNKPVQGQSGIAEVNGNDFIVSLGATINDNEADLSYSGGGLSNGQLIIGGTFMHELGHNLGLRHGGGVSATADPFDCVPPGCEDRPGYKPNYLSVMNYRYQTSGIQQADAVGSNLPNPAKVRLDYSNQVLPAGGPTPGYLHENGGLDETAGLGSGNADLFKYSDHFCAGHSAWATQGPVDWDGDGVAGDNLNATADTNIADHNNVCGTFVDLNGHADWGPGPGQSIFRYKFQCTSFFADGLGTAPPESLSGPELTAAQAIASHDLYPIQPVTLSPQPDCSPGGATALITLLGTDDFQVSAVDISSLRSQGAAPVGVNMSDVNRDGNPDLVLEFSVADLHLNPHAEKLRLTGWLKNSQAFVGEVPVQASICGSSK